MKTLFLTVTIEYESFKATDLMKMGHAYICSILRSDLDKFKLPHPAMPNVKSPTTNGIEFFYKTRDGSPLFQAVLRTFKLLSWEPGSREYRMIGGAEMNKLKERCFIKHVRLVEDVEDWRHRMELQIRDSPRYSPFPGNSRDSSHDSGLSRKPLAWYNGTHQNDRHDSGNFSPFEYDHRNRLPTVKFEPDSQNCALTLSSGTGKNEHTPVKNFQSITQEAVTTTESTAVIVARLTHEYWDTRRDIANAAARARFVESQLSSLGATIPEAAEDFADASDVDLCQQFRQMTSKVEDERIKLRTAEQILEDVLRECETPVVVPGLLKMMQMWDAPEGAMGELDL